MCGENVVFGAFLPLCGVVERPIEEGIWAASVPSMLGTCGKRTRSLLRGRPEPMAWLVGTEGRMVRS